MIDQRQTWLSSIIQHGKWYFLTSLLTKGIGFLLLPVYSSQLSLAEYGSLSSINSMGQLVGIFISLYIDAAFGRYYHAYREKYPERLKTLFSTTYFFVLLWGFLVVLGVLTLSPRILDSFVTRRYVLYASFAFIPQLLLQISQLGMIFLRQSLQSRKVAAVQVLSTALSVTLTIVLLYQTNIGFMARLIGNASAAVVTLIFFTSLFIRSGLLGPYFMTSELKKYLAFSIPLLPNVAGGWIASMSDRLIIARYDSISSTGIYSFTFQVAHIVYIIQDAITQVLGPVSMSELFRDKVLALRKICRSSRWLYLFMLHIVLGTLLFSKEAILLILMIGRGESEYIAGFYLIPLFALVYVFSSQYRMFTTIISFNKKTWVVSSAGIIMAVVNLTLNLLFVPRYGRDAAVVATVLSTLIYTIWIILWAKKFNDFRLGTLWYVFCSIFYGTLTAIIIVFFRFMLVDVSIGNIFAKILFYVILSGLLILFRRYGGKRIVSYG